MPLKWVLHWQPNAGTTVNSQIVNEVTQCVESINGVKEGRWKATITFYKPILRAGVPSHFFDGKSEASHGRVHGYMAAGFVEKIITGALHARGTKLFRVWLCRPMYFTTCCCPVCCHYGSTHCDRASSAAISKKLGNEEKEFDVCHSSTGLRNGQFQFHIFLALTLLLFG